MTAQHPGTDPEGEEPQPGAIPLTEPERRQIEDRAAPGAVVIHEVIREFGEDELSRPAQALAWSGLAAGMSMGFSLVAQGILRAGLPDEPWRPLVYRLGYPIGFLIVILGRQQLFTENTITVVLPLLSRPTLMNMRRVVRLWAVVLAANLVGTLAFAWVVGNTNIFLPAIRDAFAAIGVEAAAGGFATTLLRGIFAGWLIALMVWLLPLAGSQLAIIVIITYVVGLGGLAHIIAGSAEVLYLAATGLITYGQYFTGFMIPTLLGNIIGGVALVSALNYAQVYAGRGPENR